MKNKHAADSQYFRKRLETFIHERHPRLEHAVRLIDTRSELAAETYWEAIHAGAGPMVAIAKADTVLYEGLIFSRFDTIRCILATEFPLIPPNRQRQIAVELEQSCNEIFEKYNLDDGLVQRSEYNHLIMELITACRSFFDRNPLLLRRMGRPTHKNE